LPTEIMDRIYIFQIFQIHTAQEKLLIVKLTEYFEKLREKQTL
jgi:hypothetical protein